MGDTSAPYELVLLPTPGLAEERHHYADAAAAVIAFNQLACEVRRPAVLTKGRALPGLPDEIIGRYSPSETAPPIKVRLGKARPAFTEPGVETDLDRLHREAREERVHAANWYARGFIDCIGALSPFDSVDAVAFAEWHADSEGFNSIDEQWATWSAQRRQEKGL